MKIVMIVDFFGNDCHYQENLLTKYYIKLGHSVTIITSTFESVFDFIQNNYKGQKKGKTEFLNGTKVIRLPFSLNLAGTLRKFPQVNDILTSEAPDLIYFHNIHFNISDAARYKKSNLDVHIIVDCHADYSNSGNNWLSLNILHGIIRRVFFARYRKYVSKIFPIVPEGSRFLNEVYGIPYENMELLPLGCDYELCNTVRSKINRAEKRKNLGIGNSDFVIITGGKLSSKKRTHVLIEALKIIGSPTIHLIIFGKADEGEKDYEAYIKSLCNKNETIHLIGWLSPDESYEIMAISDIAVFPSSQSILWQQAIGMHLPIIAGDSGGQDMSYLNKNDNLIKISSEDINPEFLARNIEYLSGNPGKVLKMKEGAAKTAKEYLDYKIIAKKTLSILNK